MTTETINFTAQARTARGKGESKRLRKEGIVPGVVYGEGKPATPIQINEHDFEMLLAHHSSESLLVDLNIDGAEPRKVLLKEVQHHPVKGRVLHVDFSEVSMTRKIRVNIALNFVGTPFGVSQNGGTVDYHVRTIQVECLPGDMMETFEVDISHLDLKEHLMVSDVKVDESKFRILAADEISVVSVAAPRVSGQEAGEADEAEEGEAEDTEASEGGEAEDG